MASTIGRLAAKKRPATITFDNGEELHVEVWSQRVSPKMIAEIAESESMDVATMRPVQTVELLKQRVEMLLTLLASWDLMEPDPADESKPGTVPVPIDFAHLWGLGIETLGEIIVGIFQGAQLGE